MNPTTLRRRGRATADRLHRTLGTDILRLREDSGLTRAAFARASGVDPGYLCRIEAGARATIDVYARIGEALGADLAVRLYPNTGPAIRDRHQAGILEALLAALHPRWRAYPEIAVRRPSRGWIDAGLHDARAATFVAFEIQSELRRLEQIVRWSAEKAASLPSWEGWSQLGAEPDISQLLIVRETRATRAVANEFKRVLRAAYPAHGDDAIEALVGAAAWPGPALVWARGRGTAADPWRIVARP
jgi:transcriptional regulator with XRE-family HTH domain